MGTQKDWKPGDQVELVCGSPKMAVKSQGPRMGNSGDVVVICQWIDKDGKLRQGEFVPEQLVAVK